MSLSFDQIEIVGFNGVALSDCGRALPIARDRTSDRYFKLSGSNQLLAPQSVYTREEIEAHQKAGRLTLLPKPVCASPASTVVYVTMRFIRAFGFSNAGQLSHTLDWQPLDGKGACWAASDAADAVEKQMDEWGKHLLAKADDLLVGLLGSKRAGHSALEAEQATVLALTAARSATLRASLYLRYGTAILLSERPEKLQNLHRHILTPQFPNWAWELYRDEVATFIDCLKLQGRLRQQPPGQPRRTSGSSPRRRKSTPSVVKIKHGGSFVGEAIKTASGVLSGLMLTHGKPTNVVVNIYTSEPHQYPIKPYLPPQIQTEQKRFEISEQAFRN